MTGLPIVVVPKLGGAPKDRSFVRLSGVGTTIPVGLHNNNLKNVLRGLRERVFLVSRPEGLVPPPRPAAGVIEMTLGAYRAELLRYMRPCNRVSYSTYVGYYTGSKKLRAQAAVDSLYAKAVRRSDAISRTFVKGEGVDVLLDPAPRIISPRDARFNAEVGRWLKPMEKKIYHAISEVWRIGGEPDPTVMKGYNADQVACILKTKFDRYTNCACVGLDASRFDQHVSVEALKFEHSVYLASTAPAERGALGRLLSWQLRNKGVVRLSEADVRYIVDGTRLSGDINTALGNCLLMTAMVYAYAHERGVKCSLANNGDDCMVFMDERDEPAFCAGLEEWFLGLGFTMKREPTVYEFEQLEFCQMKPVWTPGGWVMTRSPYKGSAKDGLCKKPQMSNLVTGTLEWASSVGTAGLSLAGGIPVFQEQYRFMQSLGSQRARVQGYGDMESGFEFIARGMKREYSEIHPHTRASFYWAWGIPPDQQLAIEAEIRSNSFGPTFSVMKSPLDFSPACLY